ncbi:MAG: NrdJb [Gammaproteobacteria bacterium]
MPVKIAEKITGYTIAAPAGKAAATTPAKSPAPKAGAEAAKPAWRHDESGKIAHMHEKVERPEMLVGSTYKIRTPVSKHAFYITINDIVLNPGTPYEKRRPFEMFINSKNMDHYQWISALTLIVSAVFRKGGDVAFLVQELQGVFDPKGGYFRKGGKFMPSLVAEIGHALESHLTMIGLLDAPGLDEHQRQLVEEKRAAYEKQQLLNADPSPPESAFPAGAELCIACNTKAMVVLDNCLTCLNCGESKCE